MNCLSRFLKLKFNNSSDIAFLLTASRKTSHSSRHLNGGLIMSHKAQIRHICVKLFSPPLSTETSLELRDPVEFLKLKVSSLFVLSILKNTSEPICFENSLIFKLNLLLTLFVMIFLMQMKLSNLSLFIFSIVSNKFSSFSMCFFIPTYLSLRLPNSSMKASRSKLACLFFILFLKLHNLCIELLDSLIRSYLLSSNFLGR